PQGYDRVRGEPQGDPGGADSVIDERFPEFVLLETSVADQNGALVRDVAARQDLDRSRAHWRHEHAVLIQVLRPAQQWLLVWFVERDGPANNRVQAGAMLAGQLVRPPSIGD